MQKFNKLRNLPSNQCLQRGSPSVRPFSNLPCNSPSRTRAPCPQEKFLTLTILLSPAVPCSVPSAPQLPDVESHRGSLTFSLLFLYSFVLRICIIIYYSIVSFVPGVFPCPSLFSIITQFGLMGPGIEMQLSAYHGC